MLDFKPPKDSPFLITLAHLMTPFMLEFMLHDTRLEVVSDGLKRFKQLSGNRVVLCPNHPSSNDPEILFAFSSRANESFNFMAAREVFEWNRGLRGDLFQLMGCYSVVRGAPDRESFKTTRDLIVRGQKKVVIFPEGEVSHQNDTVMPVETGVAQMTFWAIEEMHKNNVQEPVYILPMASKYTYRGDITHQIETSIWRLEETLGIKTISTEPLYRRIRVVSEKVIASLEREYEYKPAPDAALNERIDGMRGFIIQNIASYLQVNLPVGESQLGCIRILRNVLDDFIYADHTNLSAYEKKIHDEKASKIMRFYSDLDRVVRFIAIYDGYLSEHLTQERFCDVLDRFEKEVFGHTFAKGPRLVMLDVGRAINLVDLYAEYKANKKATLHKIMDDVQGQITTMLDTLERKRTPIFVN